jgi:hypothetical protein
MNQDERDQWERFQLLMTFLDDLRTKGIRFCVIAGERLNGEPNWRPLVFDDVEKSVRRFLKLPSKAETLAEIDSMLENIRAKNRRLEVIRAIKETLPIPETHQ